MENAGHTGMSSFFQSHYGLILSLIIIAKCVEELNKHVFQSHYGLILSSKIVLPDGSTTEIDFQSHYGLILSLLLSALCSIVVAFQSHYGLILSFIDLANMEIATSFSIPLWSDFIFSLFLSSSVTWVSFQSHYGLILSFSSQTSAYLRQ